MKIFVSVVSYRDPLLKMTVESLLDNKSPRHDVVVGIFEQIAIEDSLIVKYPEFCNRPDIRYKRIDPQYSDGVCWARHINALQIKDEDFFYQVDSHMLFDKGWDRKLVNDFRVAQQKHDSNRIIITANCKNFDLDGTGAPRKQLEEMLLTCRVRYFNYNTNLNLLSAHGDHIPATNDIEPAIHICAGNFFTSSAWVKEVGYDTNIFFEGEEQVMVINSFASGYHIYHPKSIHCYHLLGTHQYITKQSFNPVISESVLGQRVYNSHQYIKQYFANFDEGILEKYYEYSGVDYINQKLDERAKTYTIEVPISSLATPLPEPVNQESVNVNEQV